MAGTVLDDISRLDAEAREHKRLSAFHRREAARKRADLARLVEYAESKGILVVKQSQPGGTD